MLKRRWIVALVALAALCACNDSPTSGIPVFLWHSVGQGVNDKYDVSPLEFEQALDAIEAAGASTVTLDQVFDAADGNFDLPRCPVIITFDDGTQNLYTQAYPRLKRHGMVAEAFIITGRIGDTEERRFVDRTRKGDYPYLLWTELQRMVDSGVFIVESHTVNHPRLPKLGGSRQRRELRDSRRTLRDRLGIPCNFAAYPYGAFDPNSLVVAPEFYRGVAAVDTGIDDRYSMTRISIHRGELDRVTRALAGCR